MGLCLGTYHYVVAGASIGLLLKCGLRSLGPTEYIIPVNSCPAPRSDASCRWPWILLLFGEAFDASVKSGRIVAGVAEREGGSDFHRVYHCPIFQTTSIPLMIEVSKSIDSQSRTGQEKVGVVGIEVVIGFGGWSIDLRNRIGEEENIVGGIQAVLELGGWSVWRGSVSASCQLGVVLLLSVLI